MLKLNETPLRTSKNFNINNIKLENIKIPKRIGKFENLEIINEDAKVYIDNNTDKISLTYGLSNDLTNQIIENSNCKTKITVNSKINKEIKICYLFDEKNKCLVEDLEIIADKDAKETIIICYNSDKNVEAYHNGLIRIIAKKDSNLNVVLVNLMNEKSNNFLSIQNELEENAKVNYCIVDFGGKNSITNYYSNLLGEKSDNRLNTIYLGKDNQVFDLNYIAELRGQKSNVNIEVQGALKDEAKKHFKGTIDFKKGCKKATGNENENCTILSDSAKSLALPMLLCSEEEVEGNHSSSAGKIEEKELFYIMSRGFKLKEAMKLIVRAKFNKILETIKNEELKSKIIEEINSRLN